MFSDSDLIQNLISSDIINWNGVVTRFGCVKAFILDGDMLRMATEEEIDHYRSSQSWYDMRSTRGKILGRIKSVLEKVATKPSHFKIVRAVESVAIQYIPKEWIRDTHLDAFVIEFFDPSGHRVAMNWLGTEFFELPIHELLPINKLIND